MVLGRCPLIVGMVCASFAGACATKMDSGSRRGSGDAGAEAGAATGVLDAAPRLPDAVPVMPTSPLHDAAVRDSGPMCPRATPAWTHDAQTTTNMDTKSRAWDGGDASAPPKGCLAPCVWELVRHCPPPAACIEQDYGTYHSPLAPQTFHSYRLACGDDDWWDSGQDWYFSNRSDELYIDGKLCYGVSRYRPGTSLGASQITWGDAAGHGALMFSNSENDLVGQAFCGMDGKPVNLPCVNEQDCQSKGILMYDVDGTAEKCAPWRRIIDAAYGQFGCEKGCCPTDPPVVPQISDAG